MSKKLSFSEIDQELQSLSGWTKRNNSLHKVFNFESFERCMDFMQSVAEICSEMNHHPEWLNIYNKCSVVLVTHDKNSITDLDVALARDMNEIFEQIQK